VVCFGFSGLQNLLNFDSYQKFSIFEVKTPGLHPLTKLSGLISDINE